MKILLPLLLILLTNIAQAQTDTSGIDQSVQDMNGIFAAEDTLKKQIQIQPLLHLKARLLTELNSLQLKTPVSKLNPSYQSMYTFTKEELNSGLSEKELIAYKENKTRLMKILSSKYEKMVEDGLKSQEYSKGIPVDIQGAIRKFINLFVDY